MAKKITTIKLIIALGLLLMFSTLQSAWAGDATLSWYPPTTNANGTSLTDLTGYKIYYGTVSSAYTQVVNVGLTGNPSAPAYTVTNLPGGDTYYFAVTAYNSLGYESGFSNEAAKTLTVSVTTTTTTTVPSATTTTTLTGGDPKAEAILSSNLTTAAGVLQTFTIGYSDSDGWQNLSEATFYIAGGGHDQWLRYQPATNSFSLDGAAGSCTAGQGAMLSTDYLTLNCFASAFSGSGNSLTVTFSLTPKLAFSGVQYRLLIYISDKGGKSNGRLIGNWSIYKPQVGS